MGWRVTNNYISIRVLAPKHYFIIFSLILLPCLCAMNLLFKQAIFNHDAMPYWSAVNGTQVHCWSLGKVLLISWVTG